jgi:chromosome segregation ATPase
LTEKYSEDVVKDFKRVEEDYVRVARQRDEFAEENKVLLARLEELEVLLADQRDSSKQEARTSLPSETPDTKRLQSDLEEANKLNTVLNQRVLSIKNQASQRQQAFECETNELSKRLEECQLMLSSALASNEQLELKNKSLEEELKILRERSPGLHATMISKRTDLSFNNTLIDLETNHKFIARKAALASKVTVLDQDADQSSRSSSVLLGNARPDSRVFDPNSVVLECALEEQEELPPVPVKEFIEERTH